MTNKTNRQNKTKKPHEIDRHCYFTLYGSRHGFSRTAQTIDENSLLSLHRSSERTKKERKALRNHSGKIFNIKEMTKIGYGEEIHASLQYCGGWCSDVWWQGEKERIKNPNVPYWDRPPWCLCSFRPRGGRSALHHPPYYIVYAFYRSICQDDQVMWSDVMWCDVQTAASSIILLSNY